MSTYRLQVEEYPGVFSDFQKGMTYGSFPEALQAGTKMFDEGRLDDFSVLAEDGERRERHQYFGYQLVKVPCPNCGKEVRSGDLVLTRDCRGIPFRHVCTRCYDKIMFGRGYDGVYYDESDERIEED